MKKKKMLWMIVIVGLMFACVNVYAAGETCAGILGKTDNPNDTAYYIQLALNIMRYVAIIALVLLSTIDYIKAIAAQDNDGLKKANSTFIKRLAYCVLIFFTPIIVKFIMSFVGVYDTCGVG